MSAPFPWQAPLWERLWRARCRGRMPHALLLTGHPGRGVSEFARRLAAALLCAEPAADGAPCGRCRSCALNDAGHHPELSVLVPEAPGKAIKVDQVRGLMDFVALKPVFGAFKVALLDPADAMNRQAANALLKTLEEPPPGTVLLLCAERRAALPLTIQSRCQRVDFPPVSPDLGGPWLGARLPGVLDPGSLLPLYDHAPLAALTAHEQGELALRDDILRDLEQLAAGRADPVEIAFLWSERDPAAVFLWLVKLVSDLITIKLAPRIPALSNPDRRERLAGLAAARGTAALFGVYDGLLEERRHAAAGGNVPALNFLEAFTMTWTTSQKPR